MACKLRSRDVSKAQTPWSYSFLIQRSNFCSSGVSIRDSALSAWQILEEKTR